MHCQATGEYGFEVFFFCVCSITGNSPRVLPSGKPGAGRRAPGFALENGQIMAPVIDDAPRLTVRPFNNAIMRADHGPLGHVTPKACLQHDDQPFGVDTQTDRAVREARWHGIAVPVKGDQAPSRACEHALSHCLAGH